MTDLREALQSADPPPERVTPRSPVQSFAKRPPVTRCRVRGATVDGRRTAMLAMTPNRDALPLPRWTLVQPDDTRHRPRAVEAPSLVSADWAKSIRAASNRPWQNAAKVVAAIVAERPDARYVEGWAAQGGVRDPQWHAWVDVPFGASEQSWLRIDPTPMWRWMLEHNWYAPVIEVGASMLAPLAAPLLAPRGRAACRLPVVPLAPARGRADNHPVPAATLAAEFGAEVAERIAELRTGLVEKQREATAMIHVDGRAELDRLEALRVLPKQDPASGR